MPLSTNSRLGPYEIKSPLGIGGMGEVYRARDSRLNRDVAIKVLRDDGASADLRSRFEREAHAVAALNHPNIVAVYDFGIEGNQQYIVSELIEGESLRSLLHGKPVPVRKLIDIAAQIADGLAAAHAADVVHRDLKPENIMLAKDGRVKILDFGLARQSRTMGRPRSASGEEDTVAPPADAPQHLTNEGAVLGTASYMSPEQALGRQLDYRSDQFSFGLILHEMSSGKQAFSRNSSVETMAAIVRDEPSLIEERIPAPLKWIIDRCLHKEPEQRYESTRDLYRELQNLRDHFSEAYSSETFAAITATHARLHRWIVPAIGAACIALAALLAYVLIPFGQDIGNYRYTPFASDAYNPMWSPDGKAVAYSARIGETYQILMRYLNSSVPIQLTHDNRSAFPLGWSSDKSHVIVLQPDPSSLLYKLFSVATVGGEPEFIMDIDCPRACDLSKDGKVLATLAQSADGTYSLTVSDPLGAPMRPYAPAPFATKDLYGSPQLEFSPDGKKILLDLAGERAGNDAWLLPYPAQSGTPKRILQNLPRYSDPTFSWMPDNRHIVLACSNARGTPTHFWLADSESNYLAQLTTGTTAESQPLVSPDGKTILYAQIGSQQDVISVSLKDGSTNTLMSTGREETGATWAANQQKLTWLSNRTGATEVWLRMPDGSERPIIGAADLPPGTDSLMDDSLSPDGTRIIFVRGVMTGGVRLWISSLSGGSPVRLTNDEQSMEYGGSWSPDGSRFVYHRIQSGKISLMVVKTNGNAAPMVLKDDIKAYLSDWSPTGEWITYRDAKGWNLISGDGKNSKFLGEIWSYYLAFSKDGKLLYGIQTATTEANKECASFCASLFSLDPATLNQKIIKELGKDLQPNTFMWPSTRFSLAPDGKSFVYNISKNRTDLWMLQGYRRPGWTDGLAGLFKR
jgi:serine/threonine protein kinase